MDKFVALESGKMVMMEFHRQHLRELAEGLPITPFMSKLDIPIEQVNRVLGWGLGFLVGRHTWLSGGGTHATRSLGWR